MKMRHCAPVVLGIIGDWWVAEHGDIDRVVKICAPVGCESERVWLHEGSKMFGSFVFFLENISILDICFLGEFREQNVIFHFFLYYFKHPPLFSYLWWR